MERRSVRDIGNVKKRKYGKFALEVSLEKDYESVIAIFAALHLLEENEAIKKMYMDVLFLFGSSLEDIRRDIDHIT
jgi:hypothetical protein